MKLLLYIGAAVGGMIGGYLPVLFGDTSMLSGWSLLGGFIGTIVGLWAGYKMGQYFEG